MKKQGTSRRDFIRTAVVAGAAGKLLAGGRSHAAEAGGAGKGSMAGYAAPKLDVVRVGLIGVGARGSGHLGDMLRLDGVEVTAIADTHAPSLQRAVDRVVKAGRPEPAAFGRGERDYRRMLERDDVDIVIISTPWRWHEPMAVEAMQAGKHAFVEVPAALTVEGCWNLVNTSEKTRRHCMMLENVCYGREELVVLNMCRQGVFGELLHGEAAYIHDLRGQMHEVKHGTGSWRTTHYARRDGNLYPTHGLGPVAQYMGINRGDRFLYMSSIGSPALGRKRYAAQHFPPDHKWNRIDTWRCSDISTSIIQTARGRSIMLQWDETSPRPYTRHNMIQGTRGCWAGFPPRFVAEGITGSTHHWTEGDALKPFYETYEHPLWKQMGAEAARVGGHGGMDFLMNWRLIVCLRNGEPLDQDVYDAAAWSAVGPLSEWSVAHRGRPADIPDFTRGRWESIPPLEIIS